nr:deoxyribodipyrimidine photo-lyase [Oceanococcus sp. HetDA_MAG_MS8]
MHTSLAVLWFKRDLRLYDHAAVTAASAHPRVLPVLVIEPEYWRQSDRSPRHYALWRQAAEDLLQSLRAMQRPGWVRHAPILQALDELRRQFGAFTLYSHQETDSQWTYSRDRSVSQWCRNQGMTWTQPRQFGVVRGMRRRQGWARQWEALMTEQPLAQPTWQGQPPPPGDPLPRLQDIDFCAQDELPTTQQDSRRAASLQRLEQFLHQDGHSYRGGMSSPISAQRASSRLSLALSVGSLSLREIVHRSRERLQNLDPDDPAQRRWRASLRSFDKRLHWHCHFIQKLETAPHLEQRNMHSAYDALAPEPVTQDALNRWVQGQTGWPFVDACMRSLRHSGWINFRMRAMLVSVASYHLGIHWRESGVLLARIFCDYEAGIHWPQVQMQSGTTGINTYRMYNPIKQGLDQDPEASFIAQWVPELASLPPALRHQPWKAGHPPAGYPSRIGDHSLLARAARQRRAGLRSGAAFAQEARALQAQLGSQASGMSRSMRGQRRQPPKPSAASRQLSLFPE